MGKTGLQSAENSEAATMSDDQMLEKTSIQESSTLEEMVSMVDNTETEGTEATEVLEKAPSTKPCAALVPYEEFTKPAKDSSPMKIFSRILSRKESDETEGLHPVSTNPTASGSSKEHVHASSTDKKQNEQCFFKKPGYKRSNAQMDLEKHEGSWLAEALAISIPQELRVDMRSMCIEIHFWDL